MKKKATFGHDAFAPRALPDAELEELARARPRLAARERVDSRLAESEAAGGETPHEDVIAELLRELRA